MRIPRLPLAGPALLALLLLSPVAPRAAAGSGDAADRYGDTYTPAELAALDRALYAVNMDRGDLRFRKDVAKGYGCLESVREMLADPLLIAPETDAFVAQAKGVDAAFHPPLGPLAVARDRLGPTWPWAVQSTDEPYQMLGSLLRQGHDRLYPAPEGNPEALLAWLGRLVSSGGNDLRLGLPADAPKDAEPERAGFDDPRYRALRLKLPLMMDWHEVYPSPYSAEVDAEISKDLEDRPDDYLYGLAARIDVVGAVDWWVTTFGDPVAWLRALPPEAFPKDAPRVVETESGRVALGTPGDDVYEGDYAALVDPGGNDRYVNCRIGAAYGTEGRRVGFFADLGGDDVYACEEVPFSLGAAILGIAAFFDLGAGNDRYEGGHASLGAAMGGVAVFYDDGGSDVYEGRTFTQGAAGFGVGILVDDSVQAPPVMTTDEGTKDPVAIAAFDNDRLSAWANAQAFARCRAVAMCENRRGNEIYDAGGVYLDAPLFADRYQSFAQGFAIGAREVDYAGGIALLLDHDGNDLYLGDIYDQGVGYWYSAGLLFDGGGNDTYEMTQYGQGSGIHLAVGGLVDVAGHDTYVMHSGLGQGGSHDYAGSILHDRGGDDRYLGNTSCNGCGLTNSVGIHIDRAGNDVYSGRRDGGLNSGRPARGFGSIGVLLDMEGRDSYLGIMKDDGAWRHTDVGVGLDLAAPEGEGGPAPAAPDRLTGQAEVPAVCRYEGELTKEVFDELWQISIRWEVGDNRVIVPEARKRLAAFGAPVLELMDGKVEERASGLEFRAFQDVLQQLVDAGAKEPVLAFLRRNLSADSARRRTVALVVTGEMKLAVLAGEVAALLPTPDAGEDEGMARRAARVLGALGSHAGDEMLAGWLDPAGDERQVQAAAATLVALEAPVFDRLRPLFDHPLLTVRTLLAASLAEHAAAYADPLRAALADPALAGRALRALLDTLARADLAPREEDVAAVVGHLGSPDFGERADAARLLVRWAAMEGTPETAGSAARAALARLLEREEDPFVRFCATPPED